MLQKDFVICLITQNSPEYKYIAFRILRLFFMSYVRKGGDVEFYISIIIPVFSRNMSGGVKENIYALRTGTEQTCPRWSAGPVILTQ